MKVSIIVSAEIDTAKIKYSENDANDAVNKSSDFVWVEVVLDIPTNAKVQSATGTIYIHFKASTH